MVNRRRGCGGRASNHTKKSNKLTSWDSINLSAHTKNPKRKTSNTGASTMLCTGGCKPFGSLAEALENSIMFPCVSMKKTWINWSLTLRMETFLKLLVSSLDLLHTFKAKRRKRRIWNSCPLLAKPSNKD